MTAMNVDIDTEKKELMAKEPKPLRIVHALVENFEPLHFVCCMGIGITSGVMYNFPIIPIRKGIRYIGFIYYFIDLSVFVITHLLFFLKFVLFPRIYPERYKKTFFQFLHSPLSSFLGCSAMGFTTLVNMLHFMKPQWWIANNVLWWINFTQTILSAFCAGFFLMTMSTHSTILGKESNNNTLAQMTPAYFLPFVTMTVNAASGALICESIPHSGYVVAMLIICLMLWACSIIISLLLFSVFFSRLIMFGIPRGASSFTFFIPIGVLGQGSWGIISMMRQLARVIKSNNFAVIGFDNLQISNELFNLFAHVFVLSGVIIAIILTAFGVLFTIWSIFGVVYWYVGWPNVPNEHTHFHVSSASAKEIYWNNYCIWTPTMWAATFPIGTLALSFNGLYETTNSTGFQVMATIYAWGVILWTTWCMIGSLLWVAPWRRLHFIIRDK